MAETSLLIVDDDAGSCETLSGIFLDKGFSVTAAHTAQEAIRKAKETTIDIALIDIELPDMDGLELLKELKSLNHEIVCMLIAAHASQKNAIEALKEGAGDYFTKPLDMHALIHRVCEALDKKRLQNQLRESEERYRGLVETSTDAIVSINEKREVIQWNRAAARIFGYSKEEVMGRTIDTLVPEKYKQKHIDGIKRYMETGQTKVIGKTVELDGLRKDGTIVPVELSLSVLKTGGSPIFTGIIRDVTGHKKLEYELKERLDESERLNRLMVGRELKMGELRKRLKKCEEELEEINKSGK